MVTRGEAGGERMKGVKGYTCMVMDKNWTTEGEHDEVYSGIDKQ